MVKCPYCSRPAMSLMRKSGLGPGRAINCQSCGKKVATHWIAVFAAIPAFLGGLVLLKSDSLLLGIAAVIGGLVMMAILQTFLVPLVRSDA
jgi:cytochrome b subunit of formate dehydrogenase